MQTFEGDTIIDSYIEAGEEYFKIKREGLERIYIFHADSYRLLVERSWLSFRSSLEGGDEMIEAIFFGLLGYFLGCLIELTLKKFKEVR